MKRLETKYNSKNVFHERLMTLETKYNQIINRKNTKDDNDYNGIYFRYHFPVLTDKHIPVYWKYDLNPITNPYLQERLGVNAVFNPGAIKLGDKYLLVARVEGKERKSFFAIAESYSPIDGFKFWDEPVQMPETGNPDTNIYDIRVTQHEDGWIYGIFCTERKYPGSAENVTNSAWAQAGIARTKDLITWERLPDLKTPSIQQRNVVLHPEFVDGKYAFYTRPQDEFIKTGSGGGIGWGLVDDIRNAVIHNEFIIDSRKYHTIKEEKNGLGPPPIKTNEGWLHLAHGVRNTADGLRYVLYLFMTDLEKPWIVIQEPGGYLIAPKGEERIGDVSNVVFSGGWIKDDDGKVFIYYASSDTRVHVASSSIDLLLDYAKNTPADTYYSAKCVETRIDLIKRNKIFMKEND